MKYSFLNIHSLPWKSFNRQSCNQLHTIIKTPKAMQFAMQYAFYIPWMLSNTQTVALLSLASRKVRLPKLSSPPPLKSYHVSASIGAYRKSAFWGSLLVKMFIILSYSANPPEHGTIKMFASSAPAFVSRSDRGFSYKFTFTSTLWGSCTVPLKPLS